MYPVQQLERSTPMPKADNLYAERIALPPEFLFSKSLLSYFTFTVIGIVQPPGGVEGPGRGGIKTLRCVETVKPLGYCNNILIYLIF